MSTKGSVADHQPITTSSSSFYDAGVTGVSERTEIEDVDGMEEVAEGEGEVEDQLNRETGEDEGMLVNLYENIQNMFTSLIVQALNTVSHDLDMMNSLQEEVFELGNDIESDIHKLSKRKYAALSMIDDFR